MHPNSEFAGMDDDMMILWLRPASQPFGA